MEKFTFRPVGQGLFYTGALLHGYYNFVYDCGSANRRYLEEQIKEYHRSFDVRGRQKPELDFVAISHLHRDHCNGLLTLLRKFRVKQICLPYLGRDAAAVRVVLALTLFGEERREGEERQELYELYLFLCGLYGVGGDGVAGEYRERVVFFGEEGQRSGENGAWVCSETKFDIGANGSGMPYWQFGFVQKRADDALLRELARQVEDRFGTTDSVGLAERLCNDPGKADSLRQIYGNVFGGSGSLNLTSMLMVHFPLYKGAMSHYFYGDPKQIFPEYGKRLCRSLCGCSDFYWNDRVTATLLTGDAMIDASMAQYVRDILEERGLFVLQAPHHGSFGNWRALRASGLDTALYVLPFGYGNPYGHPSAETVDDLLSNRKRFVCVTQSGGFVYGID